MGVLTDNSPPLTLEPASDAAGTGLPIAVQTNPAAATPRAALGPALTAPGLFGRYRIVRVLGSGAMGHVFLAEDVQLGRRVALKIPQTDMLEDASSIERFYREARAAATLRHPNICPVYDVGEIDGMHFLTMAFIEGELLSTRIERGEPIPERESALLIQKIAGALDAAHRSGIVHRDLKPANLMLDERREPIVMDFGLARHDRAADDPRLTRTGMVMGTPAYMSPEQVAAEHDRVGPASDIYSLGVIFYELLTGQRPFPGTTIARLFKQILTDEPPAPSALRPGLDPQLEDICLKMMAKEVGQRFGSMQEVVDALETWSGAKRSTARPSHPKTHKPPRSKRGNRWLTVLMGAAILVPPALPLAPYVTSLAMTSLTATGLPVTGPTDPETEALPDPAAAAVDASAQFAGTQAGQTRSDNRLN
ncbi:MAG TPA: serine/threonine-protein kinase, partial [Planctomycetaceae bacterium]|nr:serine/threonine-protein kinase [Planctomycetaceae bacterium]